MENLRNMVIRQKRIIDEKLYLISLIPFMRGYANLMGDEKSYKKLTRVMHGYEHSKINLTTIYNRLFCKDNKITDQYYVSVKEILELTPLSICGVNRLSES